MIRGVTYDVGGTLELGHDGTYLDPKFYFDMILRRRTEERCTRQAGRDVAETAEEIPDLGARMVDAERCWARRRRGLSLSQ